MIVLDTSVLIDALAGPQKSLPALRALIAGSRRILMPTLVLYEWLRGPWEPEELDFQEGLLPATEAIPFGAEEAAVAAVIYRTVPRARAREADIAIASHALLRDASVWTLNRVDFEDVPGLDLYSAA